jgi:hypothetical protein
MRANSTKQKALFRHCIDCRLLSTESGLVHGRQLLLLVGPPVGMSVAVVAVPKCGERRWHYFGDCDTPTHEATN